MLSTRTITVVLLLLCVSASALSTPAAAQPSADEIEDKVEEIINDSNTLHRDDVRERIAENFNSTDKEIFNKLAKALNNSDKALNNSDKENDISAEPANVSNKEILHRLPNGVVIHSIERIDGTVRATVSVEDPTDIALQGVVQSGQFRRSEPSRVYPGEPKTLKLDSGASSVGVLAGRYGFKHNLGGLTIVSNPTVGLIRLSAIGGAIGVLLAAGIDVGRRRRKVGNTFEEVFSGERVEIGDEPIEGWREKLVNVITSLYDERWKVGLIIVALIYVLAILAGSAPGPGDFWDVLEDQHRVVLVAVIATVVIGYLPVSWIIEKIWNPNYEFILDLDAQEVWNSARKSGSGELRAYAGDPARIADIDIDGGRVTVNSPGGRVHVLRDVDLENMEAEGPIPGLHDDRELAIEEGLIRGNREILREEAQFGRRLVQMITAIKLAADQRASVGLDEVIRDRIGVDAGSLDEYLSEVAEGTRYEEKFSDTDDIDMTEKEIKSQVSDVISDLENDDSDE